MVFSATVYTIGYGINTTNAQFPGFGGLPNDLFIEGSFSYKEEASIYSSGSQTVYNILSQTLSVNGVNVILDGGGMTSLSPSTIPGLTVGNDDTNQGLPGPVDFVLTRVTPLGGFYSIGNGLSLRSVVPQFHDFSGALLTSTVLPILENTYASFPSATVTINYSNESFSTFGNTIPMTYISFSSVPEPGTALLSMFGIVIASLRRRSN